MKLHLEAFKAVEALRQTEAASETDPDAFYAVPKLKGNADRKIAALREALAAVRLLPRNEYQNGVFRELNDAAAGMKKYVDKEVSAPYPEPFYRKSAWFLGPIRYLGLLVGDARYLSPYASAGAGFFLAYAAAVGIQANLRNYALPGARRYSGRIWDSSVSISRGLHQGYFAFRHYHASHLDNFQRLDLPADSWLRRQQRNIRLFRATAPYSLDELRRSRHIDQPLEKVLGGKSLAELERDRAWRLQQWAKSCQEVNKAETAWANAEKALVKANHELDRLLREQEDSPKRVADLEAEIQALHEQLEGLSLDKKPGGTPEELAKETEALEKLANKQSELTRGKAGQRNLDSEIESKRENVAGRLEDVDDAKLGVARGRLMTALEGERLSLVNKYVEPVRRKMPQTERDQADETEYRRASERAKLYEKYRVRAEEKLGARNAEVGPWYEPVERSHTAEIQGAERELQFFKDLQIRGKLALTAAEKRVASRKEEIDQAIEREERERAESEPSLSESDESAFKKGKYFSSGLRLEYRKLAYNNLRKQLEQLQSARTETPEVASVRDKLTKEIAALQNEIREVQTEHYRRLGGESELSRPLRQTEPRVHPSDDYEVRRVMKFNGLEPETFRFTPNAERPWVKEAAEARLLLREGFDGRPSAEQSTLRAAAREKVFLEATHQANWHLERMEKVLADSVLTVDRLERQAVADPVLEGVRLTSINYLKEHVKVLETETAKAQADLNRATGFLADFRKRNKIQPKGPDVSPYDIRRHDLRSPEQRKVEAERADKLGKKILDEVAKVPSDPFGTRTSVERFFEQFKEHNDKIRKEDYARAEPVVRRPTRSLLSRVTDHGGNAAFGILAGLEAVKLVSAAWQGHIREAFDAGENGLFMAASIYLPKRVQNGVESLATWSGRSELFANRSGRFFGGSVAAGLGFYVTKVSAQATAEADQAANQAAAEIKRLESDFDSTQNPKDVDQLNIVWDRYADATYARASNTVDTAAAGLATASGTLAALGIATRLSRITSRITSGAAVFFALGSALAHTYAWLGGDTRQRGYDMLRGQHGITKPDYDQVHANQRTTIDSLANRSPNPDQESAPLAAPAQGPPPDPGTIRLPTPVGHQVAALRQADSPAAQALAELQRPGEEVPGSVTV